jgi:hypothetical protein
MASLSGFLVCNIDTLCPNSSIAPYPGAGGKPKPTTNTSHLARDVMFPYVKTHPSPHCCKEKNGSITRHFFAKKKKAKKAKNDVTPKRPLLMIKT